MVDSDQTFKNEVVVFFCAVRSRFSGLSGNLMK